jgi:hypothetical protein
MFFEIVFKQALNKHEVTINSLAVVLYLNAGVNLEKDLDEIWQRRSPYNAVQQM